MTGVILKVGKHDRMKDFMILSSEGGPFSFNDTLIWRRAILFQWYAHLKEGHPLSLILACRENEQGAATTDAIWL